MFFTLTVIPTASKAISTWKLCSPHEGGARVFIKAENFSEAKNKAKKFLEEYFPDSISFSEYLSSHTENRKAAFRWELEVISNLEAYEAEIKQYIVELAQQRKSLFDDIEFLQGQLSLIKTPL